MFLRPCNHLLGHYLDAQPLEGPRPSSLCWTISDLPHCRDSCIQVGPVQNGSLAWLAEFCPVSWDCGGTRHLQLLSRNLAQKCHICTSDEPPSVLQIATWHHRSASWESHVQECSCSTVLWETHHSCSFSFISWPQEHLSSNSEVETLENYN